MNEHRFLLDVAKLMCAYDVTFSDDYGTLYIYDFQMPPGWNKKQIQMEITIPSDYPISPPGVGDSELYIPNGLRYKGKKPADYYEKRPHDRSKAWWCYQSLSWEPEKDDFIAFLEMVRAHMTNPKR